MSKTDLIKKCCLVVALEGTKSYCKIKVSFFIYHQSLHWMTRQRLCCYHDIFDKWGKNPGSQVSILCTQHHIVWHTLEVSAWNEHATGIHFSAVPFYKTDLVFCFFNLHKTGFHWNYIYPQLIFNVIKDYSENSAHFKRKFDIDIIVRFWSL